MPLPPALPAPDRSARASQTARAACPAPTAPPVAPLSAAYRAVSAALGHLRIVEADDEVPSGDGWVRGSDLACEGPGLESWLAASARGARERYGRDPRPDVVAGFALHQYAWPATVLFSLPWFLLRRVPRIAPGDAALHPEKGELAVRAAQFTCLPDDPAARLPGARTTQSEEGLREELRAALADHMAPLLETFRPRMRRGTRAMWGLATDELAEGLWYLGQLLDEEERARREAEEVLPGRTAPFSGGAGFRNLCGPNGEPLPTRDRLSCCLYYTLRPADTCTTCPRTTDTTRITRLTGIEQDGSTAV